MKHSMNSLIQNRMLVFLLIVVCKVTSSSPDSAWTVKFQWQIPLASKASKTVEDYFYLLPSSVLDCENIAHGIPTIEERKKMIKKSDVKNGYLAFSANSQIALFKNREEKIDVIAIQSGMSGAGNTCGSVNSIFVFDSDKKKWINRDDLLPPGYTHDELYEKLSDNDILPYFLLPQKGVEIKIKDENKDSTLYVLKWSGKKFELK